VPYQNSKLTSLLSRGLGGDARSVVVITASTYIWIPAVRFLLCVILLFILE